MTGRLFLRAATLLCALVALVWPALYNGGPFFSPDTVGYVRNIDIPFSKLLHIKTEWSDANHGASTSGNDALNGNNSGTQSTQAGSAPANEDAPKKTAMLGRSPFYGLLLYPGAISGQFWLSIFLQFLAVVAVTHLALRAAGLPFFPHGVILLIALGALSDAGFFVSLLEPDVFTGVTILACAILLTASDRLKKVDLCIGFLLIASATLYHDANFLLTLALLFIAMAAAALKKTARNKTPLLTIGSAIAVCLIGQAAVPWASKHLMKAEPYHAPFLMARLIADGPGTDYLIHHCPQSGFAVCKYQSKFPESSEDFLWNLSPQYGVLAVASPDERIALAKEQSRFVYAVFRSNPLGVIQTAFRNFTQQLIQFHLFDEFNYTSGHEEAMAAGLPARVLWQVSDTRAYRDTLPLSFLNGVFDIVIAASLCYLIVCCFRPGFRRLSNLFLWILLGVAINAAICGVIAGVFHRYQARVIWLIPYVAILTLFHEFSSDRMQTNQVSRALSPKLDLHTKLQKDLTTE